MDGGSRGLHTWEKLYWGIFVTALAGLMFSRLYRTTPAAPQVSRAAHVPACMQPPSSPCACTVCGTLTKRDSPMLMYT